MNLSQVGSFFVVSSVFFTGDVWTRDASLAGAASAFAGAASAFGASLAGAAFYSVFSPSAGASAGASFFVALTV